MRLPGKMLADILGKPLIIRTFEQARRAHSVSRVIVATDDQRIVDAIEAAGGEAVLTSGDHASGSDRIAEVARSLPEDSIIVNVQGDEPLISPDTIDKAVEALINDDTAQIATVSEPITSLHGELLNFNVVKVVVSETGNALYFSRSPMPFPREATLRHNGDPNRALEEEPELLAMHRKHIGLYVYRREYLLQYTQLPQTRLEQFEMLEQLRALENGARIKVVPAVGSSIGVDTQHDLDRVRAILMLPEISIRPAAQDDLPRVARVHVESWQRSFYGIAPEAFLEGLSVDDRVTKLTERFSRQPYGMFVAEHATGTLAGFIDFGDPMLPVDSDAQIYSFYLLPEFQRLGLGQKLFSECIGELKKHGFTSVCLDSLAASPYRKFYDKYGGTVVGTHSHMLGGEEFETVIYRWDDLSGI